MIFLSDPSRHRLQKVRLYARYARLGMLALILFYATAHAQDLPPCDQALARAETEYFEGRFDQAIVFIERCLERNAFDGTAKHQAFALLSKIYQAKGLEEQAMDALRELMTLVPTYRPNTATEPPAFVELVDRVRQQMAEAEPPEKQGALEPATEEPDPEVAIVQPQDEEPLPPVAERAPPPEKKGFTKWLLIGGGVAVAGVAAILLTGGSSDDPMPPGGGTPLPPPPAFPRR